MTKQERRDNWTPREGNDRPTRERLKKGSFALMDTEDAGQRCAVDYSANPIKHLRYNMEVIDSDQDSAAQDWLELYHAQNEIPPTLDSLTVWEPKGYDPGDGPVRAKERFREAQAVLGQGERNVLKWVLIEERAPCPNWIPILRLALTGLARHFKGGR